MAATEHLRLFLDRRFPALARDVRLDSLTDAVRAESLLADLFAADTESRAREILRDLG